MALVVQRLIDPCWKLATTQRWHTTTLAEELRVGEATEDDLYEALDWLFERKERIEKKLAAGHLTECGLVPYDVSSSFYEGAPGRTCPWVLTTRFREGPFLLKAMQASDTAIYLLTPQASCTGGQLGAGPTSGRLTSRRFGVADLSCS